MNLCRRHPSSFHHIHIHFIQKFPSSIVKNICRKYMSSLKTTINRDKFLISLPAQSGSDFLLSASFSRLLIIHTNFFFLRTIFFAHILIRTHKIKVEYRTPNSTKTNAQMDSGLNSQSLSSPSSSNSPNSGREVETIANFAMSTALLNPIALNAIFAHLGLSDLKTARLVCREWSEIGATLLGKQGRIESNSLFCYHTSDLHLITPVHPKLMGNIIISSRFDASIHFKKRAAVISKVFTILSEQNTREITFMSSEKKFIPVFLEGMKTLKSTKIQTIRIFLPQPNLGECVDERRIQACGKLPVQLSLTSLEFQSSPDLWHETGRSDEFQPALQILIDSAPNLTSLIVVAPFYPNLEGCTSLKVLEFQFKICDHTACADLNLGAVINMLAQVKDSLTVLRLYTGGERVSVSQDKNLSVPVLSKLTSVSINFVKAYLMEGFFDEEHLPKLKHLDFSHFRCTATDLSSYLNLWKRHRGVESLWLPLGRSCMESGFEFGQKIGKLFPTVKKFDFMMEILDNVNPADVEKMIEPLQKWDLKESHVFVEFVDTSFLGPVLKSLSALKGVKSVRFMHIEHQGVFAPCVPDIILHSKGFKSVEICGVQDIEAMEEMRPILEGSGTPIDFTRGWWSN
ncbi:uncharacterized protein LOC110861644 [Folsomia candida]|uniref:uncharacterized protein LOC110861644 n=1 Tax=Folsomia candida TaxID=158441 RepID=UPI001604FFC9|nr:uncharacterized protein LOC110861644 [Folsomia candida]